MKREMTQERLKQLVEYDPATGVFERIGKLHHTAHKIPKSSNQDGYLTVWLDGKNRRQNRMAWLYMYGAPIPKILDHINGNRKDNRISNLRPATVAQNQQNSRLRCDNSSGVKGVSWDKSQNSWKAYSKNKGKTKHIGVFKSFEDAVEARVRYVKETYGEFFSERHEGVKQQENTCQ